MDDGGAPIVSRTVDPTRRFQRNPRVAHQVLGGKTVILNFEGKRVLGLNEQGTLVWSLLDGARSLEEVVAEVSACAGVGATAVRDDVLAFVGELQRRDLVVELEAGAAT